MTNNKEKETVKPKAEPSKGGGKSILQRRLNAGLLNAASEHVSATQSLQTSEPTIVKDIAVDQIDRNPYQPRRDFDEDAIKALAENIDEQGGLIQPIEIRMKADGRYELICGERRLKAHKVLGKRFIRAIVNNVSDEESSARALVENIQRKDLSDFETYLGIKMHKKNFPGSSHNHVKLGLTRTEYFRLQAFDEMPEAVLDLLASRPALISGNNAEKAKQYINDVITNDNVDRKLIDKHLKTIVQRAIDAEKPRITNLAGELETLIYPGETKAKPRSLVAGENVIGDNMSKGNYLQLKVMKKQMTDEKIKRLEEFLISLYQE